MKDFTSVGRRLRRYKFAAFLLFATTTVVLTAAIVDYSEHPSAPWVQRDLMYASLWAGGIALLGFLAYAASRTPPTRETLRLAQSRHGLLTLPDVSTTFDIDPNLAGKTLAQLQKLKLAVPRWQEFRRNIWEFPDYMDLPIAPSPELAENDTLSTEKHPPTSADRQTALPALNALDHNDLASEAPSNAAPAMIATSQ